MAHILGKFPLLLLEFLARRICARIHLVSRGVS